MVVVGKAGKLKRSPLHPRAVGERAAAVAASAGVTLRSGALPRRRALVADVLREQRPRLRRPKRLIHRIAAARQRLRPSAANSPIFCTEKASQLFRSDRGRSPDRDQSGRAATSRTVRSELVGATLGARRVQAGRAAAGRLARQILRPSMTPRDSTRPGRAFCEDIVELVRRTRTRSI